MIKTIAEMIGSIISKNSQINRKDKAYLNFGLQLWLILIIETIIMLVIAYFMNIFWPVLTAGLSFLIIRKYAGGIHLPTFNLCLIATLVTFLSIGGLTSVIKISPVFLLIIILFVSFSGFILINKYAPADTKTIPITDPELRSLYKIKAKNILKTWTFLAIVASFLFSNHLNLILASSLGIFTQLLSTHPFFFYITEKYLPEHD